MTDGATVQTYQTLRFAFDHAASRSTLWVEVSVEASAPIGVLEAARRTLRQLVAAPDEWTLR